jgi:hypothetical protein
MSRELFANANKYGVLLRPCEAAWQSNTQNQPDLPLGNGGSAKKVINTGKNHGPADRGGALHLE